MPIEDEPGYLIGLIRNQRFFEKSLQRQVGESHLGRYAFLGGFSSDASQFVTGSKRCRSRQQRLQISKAIRSASNGMLERAHGRALIEAVRSQWAP